MDTKETFKPLIVKTAKGSKSYLYDKDLELLPDSFINKTIAVKINGKAPVIYPFNPFDSSISSKIPRFISLPEIDVIRFSFKLVCFACRAIGASEAKQFPSSLSKKTILEVRESFYESDVCLKVKLAVLRCLAKDIKPDDLVAIGDEFEAVGLARTDRIFYTLLWSTKFINIVIQNFEKSVRNGEKCELTVSGIRNELTTPIINSLYKTAMFFATKKLRFIATSNRLSYYDIASELLSKSLPSYYWVRPFYTRAHAINYCKASIRNWTQRLIVYYNDPVRARSIQIEDGIFTNVIRDIDGLGIEIASSEDENNIINFIDRKRHAEKTKIY